MAKLSGEVRYCLASEPTAAAAMNRINASFSRSGWDDRFVTFVLAVLDPKRHEVTLVNAGHMPPLLRHGEGQVEGVQAELAARAAQRNQLNTWITAIEHDLAERRAQLDGQSRSRYDVDRDLALAKNELAQLESEREQAEKTAAPETIKIESYPTPLSKTVDSKEAHFQLIGGRLTFVPFEALVDKLQDAMREHSRRFDEQPELTDTIGPVGGFRMRYSIERFDTPRGSILRVAQIEFLPVSSQLGETIEMAMAQQSTLREKLKMMSPRQYTITVWTYPDSFAEFRELKKELYQLGYAVAARPLPMGLPIGASPNGSKSSAE